METLKIFWLSWYEKSEDCRPITYPPNEAIAGWWNSGSRCSDGAATLCAYVIAPNEYLAWKAIDQDWPTQSDESREIRFCEARDAITKSDRFPLSDWMIERIGPWCSN